ncbi:MAG: uroporphyrinogen-III C-methyltransferase [Rhodovibrionaceae bacterium]|nr:uroporphyrinogen-III C-methyltransferase [Rhodovibrionaceae bacterium]
MHGATGRVFLVGAGPGDPDLLTVKALRVLESADAVVYDRLVSPAILSKAPAGATLISVGKQPRHHPVPQDDINALLVRMARAGRCVVRLKGGDPFIFGRGSEEALALKANGIPFEIVPGITAAQGCSAALKTPLTHRGLASGVRYLTGHCRQDRDLDFDWEGLADPDTTLVVYMGLANIRTIAERLIAAGLAGDTPVLLVNNGTTPEQRHLLTRLSDLADEVATLSFLGPVLFIIGKVAALAAEMGDTRELARLEATLATG